MSSEEVAELAQAIHSHADALYESWKKGSQKVGIDVMKRMEDTLELLADPGLTPKLEHLVSNFVKRDKAKRLQFNSGSTSNIPSHVANSDHILRRNRSLSPSLENRSNFEPIIKKPLPKSIMAVVQRFESPPDLSSQQSTRVIPVQTSRPFESNLDSGSHGVNEIRHHIELRPESPPTVISPVHFNQTPRKLLQPMEIGNTIFEKKLSQIPFRERHIPIETEKPRTSGNELLDNKFNEAEKNMRNLNSSQINPEIVPAKSKVTEIPIIKKDLGIEELEREERILLNALRTGQVVPEGNRNSVGESDHLNSRIAFAKERIRHSQEHPLTQQRLELQKSLPAPSTNLAAAVAMQQAKIKFQPNGDQVNNHSIHHININEEKENTLNKHTRAPTLLRFTAGSSVADRVQQFEKYPAHIVGTTSPPNPALHFRRHTHGLHNSNHDHNLYPPTHPLLPPKEITHVIQKVDCQVTDPPISTKSRISEPYHIQNASANNTSIYAPWRNTSNSTWTHKPDPTSSSSKPKTVPKHELIPRFYWPEGKLPSRDYIKRTLSIAEHEFKTVSDKGPFTYEIFGKLLQTLSIPLYWKKPFWQAIGFKNNSDKLSLEVFLSFYHSLISHHLDDSSKFIKILNTAAEFHTDDNSSVASDELLKRRHLEIFSRNDSDLVLVMSNFVSMIQDIIDTHPGLGFLRDAPEFHSRYVTTVISRIFYKVNRSWNGRITVSELRRSNLLRVIKRLEEETDVNLITEYFSYEHFYVIYCKFWELDKDHDLLIDKNDLSCHDDRALSSRIIERIFSGTVLRGWDIASQVKAASGKMTYSDFVWFLMSEEDKKTPTAIEYWFRCLDIDGDGILSQYELQYFYTEQENRLEMIGVEPLDFGNVFCYIVDMLRCSPKGIRLQDLKRNPNLAANFFNTFFNLDKYLEHEQRDPFSSNTSAPINENEFPGEGESDWDKYAAAEYEHLIAEDSQDHMHDNSSDMEDVVSH